MQSTLLASTMLCLFCQCAPAGTAVSNVSNADPQALELPLGNGNPAGDVATSFTTGDLPATLNSVAFRLKQMDGTVSTPYFGSLAADQDGHPGAILETYAPAPIGNAPVNTALPTFTSAGLLLQPHTTYWVIAGFDNLGYWAATHLPDQTSAYGWSIGDASLGRVAEGPWSHQSTPPFPIGRMSIDATILPEPASLLTACGLTLPLLTRPRRRRAK